MNKRFIAAAAVIGLSLICFLSGTPAYAGASGNAGAVQGDELANGNTAFALDLYHQLKNKKENLFFSPFSISTAFAMTYGGARGNTAGEMAAVLHFPGKPGTLHNRFGPLLNKIREGNQSPGKVKIALANSLWPQKNYRFRDQYFDIVKRFYHSMIYPVDFVKQTEKARLTINRWVEKKTEGKIVELLKRGILDSLTRLVLVNAIYFKADWQTTFNPRGTVNKPFYLLNGPPVNMPMMTVKHKFNYLETESHQVLEMPYADGRFSMVVCLPLEKTGLKKLEAQLTAKNIGQWLNNLSRREVTVWFPKLKLNEGFRLKKTLEEMGMRDAFRPKKANFSGMDPANGIYISAVVHQAVIEVDEKGTEAAAATAVVMKRKGAGLRPGAVFRADHPFVFIIRDTRTGTILFIGRVLNPAK